MLIWDKEILTDVPTVLKELSRQSEGKILSVLKESEYDVQTQCMFHGSGNERHPSLGISKVRKVVGKRIFEAGTCHCFTCGYSADFPNFISDLHRKVDGGIFGMDWLKKNFVTVIIEEKQPIKLNLSESKEEVAKYVSDEELDSYRYSHPYMYTRGLTDDIIDFFDVGYDKATKCITFPVWDRYGKGVSLMQRRSVNSKFFKFEKNLRKGETLYCIQAVLKYIDKIESLVVCESPIDALTSWKHGKPAVALMGCLITNTQVEILEQLPIRILFLALDNDPAGKEGNQRIRQLVKKKMLYDVDMPDYAKDLNDLKEEEWENLCKIKLLNI